MVHGLFEDRGYGALIGYMEEIKHDLEDLQKNLKGDRILVVIDDLDRCEPDKAVEVLQAINLLLTFESFIVCLGIDARVITRAIERHYEDLLAESGPPATSTSRRSSRSPSGSRIRATTTSCASC